MNRNTKFKIQKKIRRDLKNHRESMKIKHTVNHHTYVFVVNEDVCPNSKVKFMQTLCDNIHIGKFNMLWRSQLKALNMYMDKPLNEYPKLRLNMYGYFWENRYQFDFDAYFKYEETIKSNYHNSGDYVRRSDNEFTYIIVPNFNMNWLKVVEITLSRTQTSINWFRHYYDGYKTLQHKYGKNVTSVEHPNPNKERDIKEWELKMKYGKKKPTIEYLKEIDKEM